MTNTISFNTSTIIKSARDDNRTMIAGATSWENGAHLLLSGKDEKDYTNGGWFELVAKKETDEIRLIGKPNGSLLWGDKNIVRSINGNGADINGNITPEQTGCLPLSGGKINGALFFECGEILSSYNDNYKEIWLSAGNTWGEGGVITLFNRYSPSWMAGGFNLLASNDGGTTTKNFIGLPDGELIWDDKHIVRSVNGVGAGTDGNVSLNLSFLPLSGGTCSGTIYAPAFQISSDIRLKSNLEKIDSALDKVSKIVAYTYDKKGIDGRQAGVIAQDVEKVIPEAVSETDGFKTVDYSALTALLINAINELRSEVRSLN